MLMIPVMRWFVVDACLSVVAVEVITAWETRHDTLNVTVTHEYPALPDIQASVPDYDRPSCVPPSTNQLMSSTDHQATVQVWYRLLSYSHKPRVAKEL